MKYTIILFALIAFSLEVPGQDQYKLPEDANRILFLGNSITYKGLYVTYIETYLTLKYPDRNIEFMNVGLPSETVSGLSEPGHAKGAFPRPDLHERLERVLQQTDPDLVFACYGMNDGIYLPFDETRFNAYRAGIVWLNNQVLATGASIIFLTPPVYDPIKGTAYSNVLDLYSDWILSKRYTDFWMVADLHWPMKKFLEDRRKTDPSFYLAKDGVHPGEQGHWLMAREILLFLGHHEVKDVDHFREALVPYPNGMKLVELVDQRQKTMKDAWLTATGHSRPNMREGLSMEEAHTVYEEIRKKITTLQKTE